MFFQYAPNATKWIATPWNINSEHRNMMIRFRRVMNPMRPTPNITAPTTR